MNLFMANELQIDLVNDISLKSYCNVIFEIRSIIGFISIEFNLISVIASNELKIGESRNMPRGGDSGKISLIHFVP